MTLYFEITDKQYNVKENVLNQFLYADCQSRRSVLASLHISEMLQGESNECHSGRSQWPRGLSRMSAATRMLR